MPQDTFDVNVLIGGEAGQGMQTLGQMFTQVLLKQGFFISTLQSYQSRIRGGHNYFQIRISSDPIYSMTRAVDVLLGFDISTFALHTDDIQPESICLFNRDKISPDSFVAKAISIPVPVAQLFPKAVEKEIYTNVLYLGLLSELFNCPRSVVEAVVSLGLEKKSEDVRLANISALHAGADFMKAYSLDRSRWSRIRSTRATRWLCLNGNEAIALGALAAGCQFYSAYPMTPSTSILDTMAHYSEQAGVLVEQAEDEISALNMVLGASFAGVRAMTGSSGGGFALKVEALSLAGMLEMPAVIALAQRPGPATGLPTRTEQGDLEFAIFAGHGEFPKAVLTPGNHEECFRLTAHAFNLADRFQVPVLILTDQYLADWYGNVPPLENITIDIDRGKIVRSEPDYQRYALTADGISPRAFPGEGHGLVVVDSDEHTEDGHLTEDLSVRQHMMDKRLKKIELLKNEFVMPEMFGSGTGMAVVCWGSTWGVVRDAVSVLQAKGHEISMLHFKQVWPLPAGKIRTLFAPFSSIVVVENNATGQWAHVLQGEIGQLFPQRLLKYDGKPFLMEDLLEKLQAVLGNHSS